MITVPSNNATPDATALCQAHKTHPATETIDGDISSHPFLLCAAAAHRLRTYSLRPLEWFNLAIIHSPDDFWLQCDYYNEKGIALDPQVAVEDSPKFPMPTLNACTQS